MRKYTHVCAVLFMCMSVSSVSAQGSEPGFFFACEVVAIGPEFHTGTINTTLKPGACISLFTTHISSYKAPHFYTGIDFSIAPHKYNPTDQERTVMDQYEIITTTTSDFGTTEKREPLEDIQFSRMSIGIPIGYNALKLDRKTSLFMNLTPMYYRFGNDLPGDEYDITESGFGLAFKIGLDYHAEDGMFFRLSYSQGSIPAFELPLLDEIRSISGPGTFATIQLGLVFTNINRSLLPE